MERPPPGYLAANVSQWEARAGRQRITGRRAWESRPRWGIFGIDESEVGLLPVHLDGLRTVELGCGTAYVSSWLARRGARAVAVDPTPSQLHIAAALQAEFGLGFPLVRAAAEDLPLRDGTFDFAISEYGAAIWADPHRWIPEAARVLRPGGELVFFGNSTLMILCMPDADEEAATERLLRPQFGLHRADWFDGTVNFYLGHGDWIRLLRANGFEVLDLVELRPAEDAATEYPFVTRAWARQWPCEEAWRVRLVR